MASREKDVQTIWSKVEAAGIKTASMDFPLDVTVLENLNFLVTAFERDCPGTEIWKKGTDGTPGKEVGTIEDAVTTIIPIAKAVGL